MPKPVMCIECEREFQIGNRKAKVRPKKYVLCDACFQDRQIREENVAIIRRVLKIEGRDRDHAADKALSAYLYREITLWELADLIGAPFVTIPVPPLGSDE